LIYQLFLAFFFHTETASKSEAPPKNISSLVQPEKRSRRKPAFSHQVSSFHIFYLSFQIICFFLKIISQASRQSPALFNQQTSSNIESGFQSLISCKNHFLLSQLDSNELWNRMSASDKNEPTFISTMTDDSSISIISDENTNINMNSKNSNPVIKRNPNVLHSILSQQRPIAPKNRSPIATKGKN